MIFFSTLTLKYARAFLAVEHTHMTRASLVDFERAGLELNRNKKAFSYAQACEHSGIRVGEVVLNFLQNYSLGSRMRPLVELLEQHKRLYMLGDIIEAIVFLYKRSLGITACTVTTATILSAEQQERIKNFAQQAFGGEVEITYIHDPSLIAGFKISTDTYQWEHSVARQLRFLRSLLAGVCSGY